MTTFPTLDAWLTHLESAHPVGIDMGLARVTSVARTLGVDKPTYRVITVGGTNGKGSTAATLASILAASGLRTGLYTSPHLIRINERIRVDGREIADDKFALLHDLVERAGNGRKRGELLDEPVTSGDSFSAFDRLAVAIDGP